MSNLYLLMHEDRSRSIARLVPTLQSWMEGEDVDFISITKFGSYPGKIRKKKKKKKKEKMIVAGFPRSPRHVVVNFLFRLPPVSD